jgi:hypothetical protein
LTLPRDTFSPQIADTENQNADKQKTYDLAKLSNSLFRSLLILDSDEFLFCPKLTSAPPPPTGSRSNPIPGPTDRLSRVSRQSFHQHSLIQKLAAQSHDEVRFMRRVYAGRLPPPPPREREEAPLSSLTNLSHHCAVAAYDHLLQQQQGSGQEHQRLFESPDQIFDFLHTVFSCWTGAAFFDNPGKSSDISGRCPFHWNHLSCVSWKDQKKLGWRKKERSLPLGLPLDVLPLSE